MIQTLCDHCDVVMDGIPVEDRRRVDNGKYMKLGEFCSYGCLFEWAEIQRSLDDIDSSRTDPEQLQEAADVEREASR